MRSSNIPLNIYLFQSNTNRTAINPDIRKLIDDWLVKENRARPKDSQLEYGTDEELVEIVQLAEADTELKENLRKLGADFQVVRARMKLKQTGIKVSHAKNRT